MAGYPQRQPSPLTDRPRNCACMRCYCAGRAGACARPGQERLSRKRVQRRSPNPPSVWRRVSYRRRALCLGCASALSTACGRGPWTWRVTAFRSRRPTTPMPPSRSPTFAMSPWRRRSPFPAPACQDPRPTPPARSARTPIGWRRARGCWLGQRKRSAPVGRAGRRVER